MGAPGERYIVTVTSIHFYDVNEIVEKMFGIKMQVMNLLYPVTMTMGYILGVVSKITGNPRSSITRYI